MFIKTLAINLNLFIIIQFSILMFSIIIGRFVLRNSKCQDINIVAFGKGLCHCSSWEYLNIRQGHIVCLKTHNNIKRPRKYVFGWFWIATVRGIHVDYYQVNIVDFLSVRLLTTALFGLTNPWNSGQGPHRVVHLICRTCQLVTDPLYNICHGPQLT